LGKLCAIVVGFPIVKMTNIKRRLKIPDLLELRSFDNSEYCTSLLREKWEAVMRTSKKSLLKALISAFGFRYISENRD